MATAVSASSRGADFRLWPLAASALAGGAPAAVIGAALALRLKTVNRFMIGSIPALLLLSLPAVEYAAGSYLPSWFAVLAFLSPADGALRLARAAYASAPGAGLAAELAVAAAASLCWTVAASLLLLRPAVAASRGE
jgi:hypothetical protein